jgi:hypothetical protein
MYIGLTASTSLICYSAGAPCVQLRGAAHLSSPSLSELACPTGRRRGAPVACRYACRARARLPTVAGEARRGERGRDGMIGGAGEGESCQEVVSDVGKLVCLLTILTRHTEVHVSRPTIITLQCSQDPHSPSRARSSADPLNNYADSQRSAHGAYPRTGGNRP